MIKKLCHFLGGFVLTGSLSLALLAAMGLSQRVAVDETAFQPGPQALGSIRTAFKVSTKAIRTPGEATVAASEQDLNTLAALWNGSGKNIALHFQPGSDVLMAIASLHFDIFGRQLSYRLSVQLPQTDAPWQPRVKVGALPVPAIIWKRIAAHVIQQGPSAREIQLQLNNVKTFRKRGTRYEIDVAQGLLLSDFMKRFAQDASFSVQANAVKQRDLKPYLDLLETFLLENTQKVVPAEALYTLVFTEVIKREAMSGITLESRAALSALSAALSPPRFARLIAKNPPNVGWRAIKSSDGKRKIIPPAWRRARLAGRKDLSMHLAVSIGLHLHFGDADTRYAGLLKEISDDDVGGSGFDPNDILANSFGQALVSAIQQSPSKATVIARCIAQNSENMIPQKADLDFPAGPIWSQTTAAETNLSYDFAKVAVQLRDIFIERLTGCNAAVTEA